MVEVFAGNAADGEGGEGDFGGDLLEEIEAGEVVEMFGAGGESGAAAEVVGAVEHRLAGLFDVVRRDADEQVRADDLAGVVDGCLLYTSDAADE